MADYKVIFTNKAIDSMKRWRLSEAEVMDAFNQGETEAAPKFDGWNAIKKYPGREIGVSYIQKKDTGQWVIVNVWKRDRR
jgi:hypothetical protein